MTINKNKRLTIVILILILLSQLLAACGSESAKDPLTVDENNVSGKGALPLDPDGATTEEAAYSFQDALGKQVVLTKKPERVVSLMGSYAETWILSGGELVGVTNDVFTERKLDLPDETKIIGTVKDPNIEEILALAPDFVLLSPDIENHVKAAQTLEKAGISHAFFKVEHFDEYLNMLSICTDITGNKELYEKYGSQVQVQIENVLSRIDKQDETTILLIRAFSSGAKAKNDDNMVCKILDDLGTQNIAAGYESLLEDLSMEIIMQEDPDFIFVITMGDSEKAMKSMAEGLEKNPAWAGLSAVKNGNYLVLPKDLFHYKPNARWGESYEYLAKIFYPNEFK